jgi:hypothetical protein
MDDQLSESNANECEEEVTRKANQANNKAKQRRWDKFSN